MRNEDWMDVDGVEDQREREKGVQLRYYNQAMSP